MDGAIPIQAQHKRPRTFWRRWAVPIVLSLLVNFGAVVYIGAHLGSAPPVAKPAVREIHLARLPQTAVHAQHQPHPNVVPKPWDHAPREAYRPHHLAAASHAGARPAAHRVIRVAAAAPKPQVLQETPDRDPFAPEMSASADIRQPKPQARQTIPITANPTPSAAPATTPTSVAPKPAQAPPMPSPGGGLAPPAAQPTAPAGNGPSSNGAGASGNAATGPGSGSGGTLPFGMGGRGGSGALGIVYILDISGSMDSRIDKASAELKTAMSNLSPNDSFDIETFNDKALTLNTYLTPATPQALDDARQFLKHSVIEGGTNLERAMENALQISGVNEIVLITDGVPTDGETDFKKLARLIRKKNIHGVRIDTIGLVGVNPDGTDDSFDASKLLEQIANDSGGDHKLVRLGVATSE